MAEFQRLPDAAGAPLFPSPGLGDIPPSEQPKPRVYYIDLMRIVAIYLVITYHVVQGLNWIGFFGDGNANDSQSGNALFIFETSYRVRALQIGMPIFFHLSGRAQACASPRGMWDTISRRIQRLLIPFCFCYVMLIPGWQYIDEEYNWQNRGMWRMRMNFIEWIWNYFHPVNFAQHFDLAWLWFLPALFLISVWATPLFLLAEPECQRQLQLWGMAVALWAGLAVTLVWCDCGFHPTFAFFLLLGPFSVTAMTAFAPLPPHEGEATTYELSRKQWFAIRYSTLIMVFSQIGLVCTFRYDEIDPQDANQQKGVFTHRPAAAMPFLIFCAGFYVQGFFTERWRQGCGSYAEGYESVTRGHRRTESSKARRICTDAWYTFAAFLWILIVIAAAPLPRVESDEYVYPIYSASFSGGTGWGAAYIVGTWAWIGLLMMLFQGFADSIHEGELMRSELFYHAQKSCIVVYIFHWVFVKGFVFWILAVNLKHPAHPHEGLMPQGLLGTFLGTIISLVTFGVAVGGSICIYLLLLRCPRFGSLFGVGM